MAPCAFERDLMTAVHSPIEKREDARTPATGVDGEITVRPDDRETRRPSTYFAIVDSALEYVERGLGARPIELATPSKPR